MGVWDEIDILLRRGGTPNDAEMQKVGQRLTQFKLDEFHDGQTNANDNMPAKAVPRDLKKGPPAQVTGYFTQLRYFRGRTPEAIADFIGVPRIKFANGIFVMRFKDLLLPSDYENRGMTYMLVEEPGTTGEPYDPGRGAGGQWILKRWVDAVLFDELEPGGRFPLH